MLKALIRWLWPQEPQKTLVGLIPDHVTHEELEERLKKFQQQTEWMMDEWYEKFSTLHARAEKRVNRDRKNREEPPARPDQLNQPLSVLSFRKPWSV